jgi:hypothetical protein
MVRDPLDELIEDLEQPAPAPLAQQLPDFAELQRYLDVIMYGSDRAKQRLQTDPAFRRFTARLAGRAGTTNA